MRTIPGLPKPFQSGFRLVDGSALNQMLANMAAMVPWPGNVFWLDPANGDDLNDGSSPNSAFATLTAAYAATVSGNNDVIILMGDGTTAAIARLAATLTWAKDATHLIGITAPVMEEQRARISTPLGATVNINPLLNVTGSGCIFQNFSTFQGVGQATTDEKLIDIAGHRNYFNNVQFGGMGHANGAARAGSYVIGLNGGGENLFEHCSIGLETIARSAANASVKLLAASQRNQFRNCEFPMYPTANTPLFVNANLANGLNGSTMKFTRCAFRGLLGASSGTQPAVTSTIAADVNGDLYFDQCSTVAAKWAAATARVHVSGVVANGFNGGVFQDAADL